MARHEPCQAGDRRSFLPRHAHGVRATQLNSSLGVMGKTVPPLLRNCLIQHHPSHGGREAGSGPAQPHIPQGLPPALRSKPCALSPSGDTVVSEEGFTPAQGAGAHHRRGQPGRALTGDSSRALQPGKFPPANGSEKESVKKGPKRPAEGCGFWSAGTSGQSTGDLC